jgi:competence protein ComEC
MFRNRIQYYLRFVLLVLVIVSIVIAFQAFSQKQSLEIVFIDVGQGDATLITTPAGTQILIDGGKYRNLGSRLSRHMGVFDRSIDVVVATHPDTDHTGGLVPVSQEYDIDLFASSPLTEGASASRELLANIERYNIEHQILSAGDVIHLDSNIALEALSPPPTLVSSDANEHSLVFRLVYGDVKVMLMGDASVYNEFDILNFFPENLDADILKVGHHGSKTSTAENFVEAVDPDYAIVSAGCDNNFGHPHVSVLETLAKYRVEVFDTCTDGDIVFESDGFAWEIKTEK